MTSNSQPSRTAAFLKLLFIVHLILSSWGMSSASPFSTAPISYIYYNILYMASLIWAIASKVGIEAPALALLTNVSTTVLDIITLSLYWPVATKAKVFFGLAIANAVARPLTGLLLYQLFKERDTDNIGFAGIFTEITAPVAAATGAAAGGRAGYQGIGGNTQTAPPPPRAGAGGAGRAVSPTPTGRSSYQGV